MPGQFPLSVSEVSLSLPWGIGSVKWKPDPAERQAAWSLYVELVTRVAVQPLEDDRGLLRESLSSLHNLFATTREILRTAGPNVGGSRDSIGGIAIAVLNNGLRPFLSAWHPRLQSWEAQRPTKRGPHEHEALWPEAGRLRAELESLREELNSYATALGKIAGLAT